LSESTTANVSGTRSTNTVYVFERKINPGTNAGVITLGQSTGFIYAGGSSDAIIEHKDDDYGEFSVTI
jgi:hypothetical protein